MTMTDPTTGGPEPTEPGATDKSDKSAQHPDKSAFGISATPTATAYHLPGINPDGTVSTTVTFAAPAALVVPDGARVSSAEREATLAKFGSDLGQISEMGYHFTATPEEIAVVWDEQQIEMVKRLIEESAS